MAVTLGRCGGHGKQQRGGRLAKLEILSYRKMRDARHKTYSPWHFTMDVGKEWRLSPL
jgi:hypothetical protein